MLTADEVAEILQVPRQRVYTMAKEGILPAVRLGRQVRFSEEALRAFIEAGGKSYSGGWRKQ